MTSVKSNFDVVLKKDRVNETFFLAAFVGVHTVLFRCYLEIQAEFASWHLAFFVVYLMVFVCIAVKLALGIRMVGVLPFFDKKNHGSGTFHRGYGIGRNFKELERFCHDRKLDTLSQFGFVSQPVNSDDFEWHCSTTGSRCVDTLIRELCRSEHPLRNCKETIDDLVALQSALASASSHGARFSLALRLGPVGYSDLAWSQIQAYP